MLLSLINKIATNPMTRNTFLLALLVYATQAVRLLLPKDSDNKVLKTEDGPMADAEELPTPAVAGECEPVDPPTDMAKPFCFDGKWLEEELLHDPAFWACGFKPTEGATAPVCNFQTGHWDDPLVTVDDEADCGDVPEDIAYPVCNFKNHKWQPFKMITENDFSVCGEKPVALGFGFCNLKSEKWEPVGAIKFPDLPTCGEKPQGVTEDAICNEETGNWTELIVVSTPPFATCTSAPPAGIRMPVCDVVTGIWLTSAPPAPVAPAAPYDTP